MMTVFWDMKATSLDFFEKGTTMNSERYCEILNRVRHDVYSKRRGLTSKGMLFLSRQRKVAYSQENSGTN